MRINFVELQDKIKSQPELIETILEKLNYIKIHDKGSYYSAGNNDGDNPNALCIYKDTLKYTNYTRGHSGNIISLVMNTCNCEFYEAINLIAKWIGFQGSDYQIKYPFHSFYKQIIADQYGTVPTLEPYPEDLLPPPNNYSLKWIKEGVDLTTQRQFGIRYDLETNGIIIPEFSIDNVLIGAKWRNADPNCEMNERWNMYLKFNQSYNLYGFNINYPTIINKGKVIILEAEKSCCHLYSWGCGLGVSINGHHISKTQQTLLKSLMCDEIIIGFDKDVKEEEVRYNAEQLKINNMLYKNKISYIYDNDGLLGEKDSPTDKGSEVFKELFKRRIRI